MAQDALLGGGGDAVGIGGLDLDLQEHLQEGDATVALAPELGQHPVQVEVVGLAPIEQLDSGGAQVRRQIHALHDRLRQGNLPWRDPAIGLGHVAQHREGGGKEGGLDPLPITGVHFLRALE